MFKQLHKDEIAGLNQTISELEMSNSNGVKEWAKHRDQMASDLKLLREQLVSTQQTNEDIEHRVIVTTKELNDRIENLEDEKTALVLDLKNANESKW